MGERENRMANLRCSANSPRPTWALLSFVYPRSFLLLLLLFLFLLLQLSFLLHRNMPLVAPSVVYKQRESPSFAFFLVFLPDRKSTRLNSSH